MANRLAKSFGCAVTESIHPDNFISHHFFIVGEIFFTSLEVNVVIFTTGSNLSELANDDDSLKIVFRKKKIGCDIKNEAFDLTI